jgi:hypothetical protein
MQHPSDGLSGVRAAQGTRWHANVRVGRAFRQGLPWRYMVPRRWMLRMPPRLVPSGRSVPRGTLHVEPVVLIPRPWRCGAQRVNRQTSTSHRSCGDLLIDHHGRHVVAAYRSGLDALAGPAVTSVVRIRAVLGHVFGVPGLGNSLAMHSQMPTPAAAAAAAAATATVTAGRAVASALDQGAGARRVDSHPRRRSPGMACTRGHLSRLDHR